MSRILLDDQAAVTCARKLGLDVTRTPLIYGEASELDTEPKGETG